MPAIQLLCLVVLIYNLTKFIYALIFASRAGLFVSGESAGSHLRELDQSSQ